MSPSLRLRRLDALSALLEQCSADRAGQRLADALDAILDASPATAAAAFGGDGGAPLATRRCEAAGERALNAIAALAARGASAADGFCVADLERSDLPDAAVLGALGAGAALAVPLVAGVEVEGVIVLLYADRAMLDEETQRFVHGVARVTALALARDAALRTEQQLQDELRESGRMATLGLYTTSIAHELRGPAGALVLQHEELKNLARQLTTLGGPCDTAIGGAVSELSEIVSDMGVAVDRMRNTVSQLTTFGRRETRASRISLADVVREALAIARPHLDGRGVLLTEELEPECFTLARPDNIAQVVLNLVFNASDAAQHTSPPRIWVKVQRREEHVRLLVEDNGPGIPEASLTEIFKPFYTTKQRGKGTGLGLKIVHDVVTAHGGEIEVDERAGGGAVFRVTLPRAAAASLKPVTSSVPALASGMTPIARKVLVVEDDPVFARTVRRALRPHDVRVATSASEAEIALLDASYVPDLIVCDVFLPGANGNVLHARLVEQRPELAARFVFVTGGALGKVEADYLRSCGCTTLFKPVDVRSLSELLEPPETALRVGARTAT